MKKLSWWARLKALYVFFLPIRFSFLALVILAFAVFLSDQGWDILRSLAESKDPLAGQFAKLVSSSMLLALGIWFWSRHLLRYRPHARDIDDPCREPVREPLPEEHPWATRWWPRLLGLLVFVIEIGGFANVHRQYPPKQGQQLNFVTIYITLVVTAIVYFVFVTWRRKLLHVPANEMFTAVRSRHGFANSTRIPLLLTIVLEVALFVWALVDPISWKILGGLTVLILTIGVWVPIGSALVGLGEWLRFPILSFLLIWAFGISRCTDNHPIRTVAGPMPRITLQQAFDEWHKRPGNTGGDVPAIVVATEGGGIRATYWTAQVLTQLQDLIPQFKDHVFAISGISGGALGAVEFNALLAERAEHGGTKPLHEQAGDVLKFDAVSGTLAALGQPDFLQRFIPATIFSNHDRAKALETGWERGWEDEMHNRLLSGGFLQTMHRHPDLPVLLLTGTIVETGERSITSQVSVRSDLVFRNAVDAFDKLGTDIPMSTAAHMSARFTYISPAGKVPNGKDGVLEHVVDGGYFEVSGAVGAAEIVEFLRHQPGVKPLVLVIDYRKLTKEQEEKDVTPFCPAWGICGPPPPSQPNKFGNEVLSPPLAVLHARNARGTQAVGDLTQQSRDAAAGAYSIVEFRLVPRTVPLPLGWVLSDQARTAMEDAVTCEGGNRTAIALVAKHLALTPATVQCRNGTLPLPPPVPPACDTRNCEPAQAQMPPPM